MTKVISLARMTGLAVLGTRFSAQKIRRKVNEAIEREGAATIDFSGLTLTQSFADELIGPLILEYGPSLLRKVQFQGCSEDVRAVITFVVNGRLQDYRALRRAASPHRDSAEPTPA